MTTDTTDTIDLVELAPATVTAAPAARSHAIAEHSPMGMMLAAVGHGASLEQLEKMLDLQARWEAGEARKAYNRAFADFKAQAVRVLKSRQVTDGPLKGKAYAELHAVVDAVTPALSANGLSASWSLTKDERDWIEVTCTLKHVGGHSECVSMGGPPDTGGAKNAIQARASTISYLERYTLKAICGVAEGGEDDDGNGGPVEVPAELLAEARAAAMEGWASLREWIGQRTEQERRALDPESDNLKAAAKAADKARAAA